MAKKRPREDVKTSGAPMLPHAKLALTQLYYLQALVSSVWQDTSPLNRRRTSCRQMPNGMTLAIGAWSITVDAGMLLIVWMVWLVTVSGVGIAPLSQAQSAPWQTIVGMKPTPMKRSAHCDPLP